MQPLEWSGNGKHGCSDFSVIKWACMVGKVWYESYRGDGLLVVLLGVPLVKLGLGVEFLEVEYDGMMELIKFPLQLA